MKVWFRWFSFSSKGDFQIVNFPGCNTYHTLPSLSSNNITWVWGLLKGGWTDNWIGETRLVGLSQDGATETTEFGWFVEFQDSVLVILQGFHPKMTSTEKSALDMNIILGKPGLDGKETHRSPPSPHFDGWFFPLRKILWGEDSPVLLGSFMLLRAVPCPYLSG